ncbi:YtcA family lipoprotein [Paenalcaligenes sp. Me131]|uniref:YtcA family lipoprotein n=1 Tax=Paenalcaligenes sp. Me131 TaxID=3392636 RepID=UPI003D2AAC5E
MKPLKLLFLFCIATLSGCGQARAPSFLLFGSYFPSWLIGVGVAIPIVLLIRWGLIRTGIEEYLPARLLVYVSMVVLCAMAFAFIYSPR